MAKPAVVLALMAILVGNPAHAKQRRRPRTMMMEATAFSRATQDTAAGTVAHRGIVAADPAVLPLGTLIRISGTTSYDGNYLVTDTGSAVKGRHIDLYLPSTAQAKQFGTRTVRVQIRKLGTGTASAQRRDAGVRRQ